MIQFSGRGIVLDIEGTTSSISFVYDVLFPFARRELAAYLGDHWHDLALANACDAIARDAGYEAFTVWMPAGDEQHQRQRLHAEVLRLMDADAKTTGLKMLQGLVWERGFCSGELKAHVYPDVAPALRAWRDQGIDVRIYSSGSAAAQRLFFGHTVQGDLLSTFSGHYDTTIGAKREPNSYRAIAADMQLPANSLLFLSDLPQELDAAALAGWATSLVVRPGNAPVSLGGPHPVIQDFAQVRIS